MRYEFAGMWFDMGIWPYNLSVTAVIEKACLRPGKSAGKFRRWWSGIIRYGENSLRLLETAGLAEYTEGNHPHGQNL